MQALAKVTSKGQITIPQKVRTFLGLRPGDSVVFESGEDGVRVRPESRENVFEKYRGIGTPGISPGREAVVKYFRDLRGHHQSDGKE